MKKLIISLFFYGLLISSCQKDETLPEYPYEAEVLGRNSDCGIYAIKILNGLPEVKSIVGSTVGDSVYIAKNLPTELETVGLKIMLDVRKLQNNELSVCTHLGLSYSWLYVKRAIKK